MLMAGLVSMAQGFEEYKAKRQSEFKEYRDKRQLEFETYRDSINRAFAYYMRNPWTSHEMSPGLNAPASPDPPNPVIREPDIRKTDEPLPFRNVIQFPDIPSQPEPAVPLPDESSQDVPTIVFSYYGTPCYIPADSSMTFVLSGLDESAVADAWEHLTSHGCMAVVSHCLAWRELLKLCDWGYVHFVKDFADAFFSGKAHDESCIMQMFILAQSGYNMRIGRTDDRLVLLFPSDCEIFGYPYISIGNTDYYIAALIDPDRTVSVFEMPFPGEQEFSLAIRNIPDLAVSYSEPRTLHSEKYGISVNLRINENLIDFYDEYPLGRNWDIYSTAAMSAFSRQQLYPVLSTAVSGKPESEAVHILLDFVQTAFDYKTDDEQFGYERPLFADETLFYPYSDCEDRAILFSVLVREIAGLDVVLLHYPGHLAAAVRFNENVSGDYIVLDGQKFVVCDPTYIGAGIGESMPDYRDVPAEVIKCIHSGVSCKCKN